MTGPFHMSGWLKTNLYTQWGLAFACIDISFCSFNEKLDFCYLILLAEAFRHSSMLVILFIADMRKFMDVCDKAQNDLTIVNHNQARSSSGIGFSLSQIGFGFMVPLGSWL